MQAHFATLPHDRSSRGTANTRAILTRSVVMIPDVLQDPEYAAGVAAAVAAGYRSILAVPLLTRGQAIGAIPVARPSPGRFPTSRSRCCRPSPTRR